MNIKQLKKGVSSKDTKQPNSINSCLIILGAKREQVYSVYCPKNQIKVDPFKFTSKAGIYDRYTIEELQQMAKELYRGAIKKYHPDRHSRNRKFYEKKAAQINQAYQKAEHILKRRRA